MALFTSFLTFDTSNYNCKHNVLLFKDFICAPCIYNIKNNVVIIRIINMRAQHITFNKAIKQLSL
jgi:hypothetical protein